MKKELPRRGLAVFARGVHANFFSAFSLLRQNSFFAFPLALEKCRCPFFVCPEISLDFRVFFRYSEKHAPTRGGAVLIPQRARWPSVTHLGRPDADTAYHEAGHAVAAVLCNVRLKRVSILRTRNILGRTEFSAYDPALRPSAALAVLPDFLPKMRERRRGLWRQLIAYCAGPVVEAIATRRDTSVGASDDIVRIRQAARALAEYGRYSADRAIAKAVGYTFKVMARPDVWPAVEALVDVLLRRREIAPGKAYRIIRKAME
jgi:hypothetical protein